MATTKARVSVVRIPRHSINQINPNENHDDTVKDPSTSHSKSHDFPRLDETSPAKKGENNVFRTKTDVFTLTLPRVSDVKSDDLDRQTARTEPSKSSTTIQQQPVLTSTWMKSSSTNLIRPELNWKATGRWSHAICSFSEDMNMCCYACGCWCCFRHEISTMMGEHWCLWFVNCIPLMELRTKFRQQYKIHGSIAEDFCCATFCPLCVALQLANEGRDYGHRIFS